jgi:hypothetical protein
MKTITRLALSSVILVMVFSAATAIAIAAQDANLVRVNVSVTESSRDRAVVGLTKDNFKIWEDDVAQEIVSMTPGADGRVYVLAYKPTNAAKDGKWRKLQVKVIPSTGLDGSSVLLTVHIEAGYYAPSPGN